MSLRETLDIIHSAPEPPNEETSKLQIVVPILAELGWDARRQEIVYEYFAGGGEGGRVDIALMGPNRLVALIEAKRPGTDLSHHVSQMLRYAFYEGVDICVLTTGLEWWLYLPMEHGPPPERQFAALHIRETQVDKLANSLETFLGKKNLLNGHAKDKAKQALQVRRQTEEKAKQQAEINTKLPGIIRSMLTEPDGDLVEMIRQRTDEKINLRPDRDQVIAALRDLPYPPVGPSSPITTGTTPTRKPKPPRRPTRILLWRKYYKVVYWREVLLLVAEGLYQRYPDQYDRILTLRGTKRPYASLNPEDLIEASRPVGNSGIYLEIYLSAQQIHARVYEFLAVFDHPRSDLEVLYD